MLKITAPFKKKDEVAPLIEAGADELYCGYLSPLWVKKYTSLEFERKGGGSNFTDLKELKDAVDLAHKKNTPVFLTVNGLYVKSQYPLLLKIIKEMEKIDFDAFIVADIGLLLTLKEMKTAKKIHISTGGTVFNSEAALFYKNLGASRIVLDRQTTLRSMKDISDSVSGIDFEAFILNTLCVYIDGFCTFVHMYGRESSEEISRQDWAKDEKIHFITTYDPEAITDPCRMKYSTEVFNAGFTRKISRSLARPTFYKHLIDGTECGACALYDITRTKIKSVKIVGRQLSAEIRLKSTEFIRKALDTLIKNKGITRRAYYDRTRRLYRDIFKYKGRCRGNNCYYSETLYKRKEN